MGADLAGRHVDFRQSVLDLLAAVLKTALLRSLARKKRGRQAKKAGKIPKPSDRFA
jgi:hypothetical protein